MTEEEKKKDKKKSWAEKKSDERLKVAEERRKKARKDFKKDKMSVWENLGSLATGGVLGELAGWHEREGVARRKLDERRADIESEIGRMASDQREQRSRRAARQAAGNLRNAAMAKAISQYGSLTPAGQRELQERHNISGVSDLRAVLAAGQVSGRGKSRQTPTTEQMAASEALQAGMAELLKREAQEKDFWRREALTDAGRDKALEKRVESQRADLDGITAQWVPPHTPASGNLKPVPSRWTPPAGFAFASGNKLIPNDATREMVAKNPALMDFIDRSMMLTPNGMPMPIESARKLMTEVGKMEEAQTEAANEALTTLIVEHGNQREEERLKKLDDLTSKLTPYGKEKAKKAYDLYDSSRRQKAAAESNAQSRKQWDLAKELLNEAKRKGSSDAEAQTFASNFTGQEETAFIIYGYVPDEGGLEFRGMVNPALSPETEEVARKQMEERISEKYKSISVPPPARTEAGGQGYNVIPMPSNAQPYGTVPPAPSVLWPSGGIGTPPDR